MILIRLIFSVLPIHYPCSIGIFVEWIFIFWLPEFPLSLRLFVEKHNPMVSEKNNICKHSDAIIIDIQNTVEKLIGYTVMIYTMKETTWWTWINKMNQCNWWCIALWNTTTFWNHNDWILMKYHTDKIWRFCHDVFFPTLEDRPRPSHQRLPAAIPCHSRAAFAIVPGSKR